MHITTHGGFPHHRLDAYRVSLELAVKAKELADAVPRGYRTLADQLQRSGTAPVMLVAEGANRYYRGTKRQRVSEARGEAGECAAATELAAQLGLVPAQDAEQCIELADRLCAMLTRLIRRFS